jgi:hypothetical protein
MAKKSKELKKEVVSEVEEKIEEVDDEGVVKVEKVKKETKRLL